VGEIGVRKQFSSEVKKVQIAGEPYQAVHVQHAATVGFDHSIETSPNIPSPSEGQIRACRTAEHTLSKKTAIAAGFIIAVLLRSAAFALSKESEGSLRPARFTTKGSRKSEGFIVSQKAGSPNSTNSARICNRISDFSAKEFGTRAATAWIAR
jgi:hypothetical protein